jgi:hypothetical protein
VLGGAGHVFFPKLGEEQMMTFSKIGEDFLRAQGLEPDYCTTEAEALEKAAARRPDDRKYPVLFTPANTSGEKSFEEFYTPDENIDLDTFKELGFVKNAVRRSRDELSPLISELREIMDRPETDKSVIVAALAARIPNFEHIETGRSLDGKM